MLKRILSQKKPLEVFCKKGVLRNFVKFTGKYLRQSLFFNKVGRLLLLKLSLVLTLKKDISLECFLTHSARKYFEKLAFKKKNATLNGCISKARMNSESKLTFSKSSFNFIQKSIVFCTL